MKLIYKGSDILKRVSVNQCVVEKHAELESDTLLLRFNDVKGSWSQCSPEIGDEIELSEGTMSTGVMYVSSVSPKNGLYTLCARSSPLDFKNNSFKSWEEVKFSQLAKEIAGRHGLRYEGYDVTDWTYPYLAQRGEPDSSFLQHRCQIEGYAMIVRDKKLVIYDERSLETAPSSATLKVGRDGVYEYPEDASSGYGYCKVISGSYSGSFKDPTASMSNVYVPQIPLQVGSNLEAERFAKNLLRLVNKYRCKGYVRKSLMLEYAPGTVLKLETDKAKGDNGRIFVTRVRHDFMRNETKLWFRKPLEGY